MWILWTLLGIILFLIIVCFVMGYILWSKAIPTPKPETYLNRHAENKDEVDFYQYHRKIVKDLEDMPTEDVEIKSFDGLTLHAFYREASSKTNKTIISVHGYLGGGLFTAPEFSYWLVDYNYNILFIDLRSYGKSEGKYTTYGVEDYKDVLKWIDYIVDRNGPDSEIALFGISMGGNTVCNTADKVPSQVKCIIDDCGFTSAYEEFKYMTKELFHLPVFILFFANIINLLVCHFGFKDADARVSLKKARVPMLFIHSKDDTFVPTYMGLENFEACTSEKEMKLFEGAAHARSLFKHQEEYKRCVLDFLAKYF